MRVFWENILVLVIADLTFMNKIGPQRLQRHSLSPEFIYYLHSIFLQFKKRKKHP